MRRLAFLGTLIASAVMAMTMLVAPAQAQATRTWVSGVGDDANPCSRTAPCKTFAGAISKTAPNGEINCLDPGGFGAVTITKAITIYCTGVIGGVLASGVNGIIVNAGAADVVRLIGLDINGSGTGLDGVKFLAGGALVVQDCKIYGFTLVGIRFTPAALAKLEVNNTSIWDNGSAAGSGAGIFVKPSAGGARVVVSQVIVDRTSFPIAVDGSTAPVSAAINDSVFANSLAGPGISVTSAGNATAVNVIRSTSYGNVTGIQASGSGAVLHIGQSIISNNTTGVNIVAPAAATSFGTNQINDNTSAGSALPIVGPT